MILLRHLTLALLLAAFTSSLRAEMRVFVNNLGASLRGELVSISGDQVTIRREDGKVLVLSASSFCSKDQVYFKEHGSGDNAVPGIVPTAINGFGPENNGFLGVGFGTNEETALKVITQRTHATLDKSFGDKSRLRLIHGRFHELETESYFIYITNGKLTRVNVFGFRKRINGHADFEAVTRFMANRYGPPVAEVDAADHVHQEWTYPVGGQAEPYRISIDFTPSNTKFMLIYEGPPVPDAHVGERYRPSGAAFTGTRWFADGTNVELAADGAWVEHWGSKIWHGTWKPTTESEIVASREDGLMYHFTVSADGHSLRRSDSVVFKQH